ncbi:hypothetical protein ACLKA7_012233 [Drosophila subpalustris]
MPIGKVPQTQSMAMARKASASESPSMDSTIDSRMSNSELLPMELLKVNYVHQCKQAMMRKSNEPLPTPHLNNPARFMGYRRQVAPLHAVNQVPRPGLTRLTGPLSPNSAHKPLPALPPPTVESWLLLAKPTKPRSNDSDCCCSQSACSCSDSNSDVTEASTVTPDCEKSQSWNYRDIRRDIARVGAGAAAGIKSRADRIARIERRSCQPQSLSQSQVQTQSQAQAKKDPPDGQCATCVLQPDPMRSPGLPANRMQPKSRIPKPMVGRNEAAPYSEANVQLQRRVKQLFQQEVVHSHTAAPRWMFQKAGSRTAAGNMLPDALEQQSPRLQQKSKLDRVHIRKKRQPLHIVNQLTGERARASVPDNGYMFPPLSPTTSAVLAQGERMKRFSLESCSDSGVSSSNDTKEQQTKQTNLRQEEKCVDCVQVLESPVPGKHKHYERAPGSAQLKAPADPNDLQNFAKKNVTKATTNELLTAAAVAGGQLKQCNIEKERHLNNLNHQSTATTTISIDDSWVQESCRDPSDDYMETDSLMLSTDPQPLSTPSRNSVKIFVHSSSSNDVDGGKGGKGLSRSRHLAPSSRDSMSSSGCGGSSRDNSSLCESEQDCCSCSGHQSSIRASSPSCASYDCCNAIGGVYWNNACYQIEADAGGGAACCCSLSSCDEDDCSYYEGDFVVELDHRPPRHNTNKLPRKVGSKRNSRPNPIIIRP